MLTGSRSQCQLAVFLMCHFMDVTLSMFTGVVHRRSQNYKLGWTKWTSEVNDNNDNNNNNTYFGSMAER